MPWNKNAGILKQFSLLATQAVVNFTTFRDVNNRRVVSITTFPFQCIVAILSIPNKPSPTQLTVIWFAIHRMCHSDHSYRDIIWICWGLFCWWWWPWLRHQMETFSALLALWAGNSPVTGKFPAQRPVTQSFHAFFDLRLNKRLSKQSQGWWFKTPSWSLWCHRNGCCFLYSTGSLYWWSLLVIREPWHFHRTSDENLTNMSRCVDLL